MLHEVRICAIFALLAQDTPLSKQTKTLQSSLAVFGKFRAHLGYAASWHYFHHTLLYLFILDFHPFILVRGLFLNFIF